MKFLKKDSLFQGLFFLSLSIYLLSTMLEATTFSNLPLFFGLIAPLRKVAWLLLGIKIAAKGITDLLSGRYTLRIFPLLFFAGMVPCWYFSRSPHIISLSLLILAAHGISFKGIGACVLSVQGAAMAATLSAYFLGKIPGVDVLNPGESAALSLGYNSPNCLMLVAFQMVFLYSCLRRERTRWFEYLGMFLFATAIFGASHGRIGYFCTLLVLLALWLHRKNWVEKLLQKLRFFVKPFATVLTVLFLVLAVVAWKYELIFLQELTTYRLYFAYMALANIGLTLFGKPIAWMGHRGANLGEGYNYNYVDSSYAKSLLDFGVIPMALFHIAFYLQKSLLYRKKDYFMLLLVLIIEVYCFFESFWIPPIYNTTILLLKDVLYPLKEKENKA